MSAIKNRIMFSDKLGLRSTPLNVSYVIVNTRLLKMELAYLCSRFQMPVGPEKSHHQKRRPDNSRFSFPFLYLLYRFVDFFAKRNWVS